MQGLSLLNLRKNVAGQGGSPVAGRKVSRSTLDRYERNEVKVNDEQEASFESYSERSEQTKTRNIYESDTKQNIKDNVKHETQMSERIEELIESRGQAFEGSDLEAVTPAELGVNDDYGFENFDFDMGSDLKEGAGNSGTEEKGNVDEGIGVPDLDAVNDDSSPGVVDFTEGSKLSQDAEFSLGHKKSRKKKMKKTSRVKFADLEQEQGFDQMVSVSFDQEHY